MQKLHSSPGRSKRGYMQKAPTSSTGASHQFTISYQVHHDDSAAEHWLPCALMCQTAACECMLLVMSRSRQRGFNGGFLTHKRMKTGVV